MIHMHGVGDTLAIVSRIVASEQERITKRDLHPFLVMSRYHICLIADQSRGMVHTQHPGKGASIVWFLDVLP